MISQLKQSGSAITGPYNGARLPAAAAVEVSYQDRIQGILEPLVSNNLLSRGDAISLVQSGSRQLADADVTAGNGDGAKVTSQRAKHCEFIAEVASLGINQVISKEELRQALLTPEAGQKQVISDLRNLMELKMALYQSRNYDVPPHASFTPLSGGEGLTADCLRLLSPEMLRTMKALIAKAEAQ